MPTCPSCSQDNPTDANFCSQCGQALVQDSSTSQSEAPPSEPTPLQVWEAFVGPSKSLQFSLKTGWLWRPAFLYFREKFAQLETPAGPRFSLSWNWPAAVFQPFIWFLYRKMYMFAGFYFIFPLLAVFYTKDIYVVLVSRILAGLSANFLYFWHMKDAVTRIMGSTVHSNEEKAQLIREEGGVQSYVFWLGAVLDFFYGNLLFMAGGVEFPIENLENLEGNEERGTRNLSNE